MRFLLIISLVFSFSCSENEPDGPTTQPSLETTKHAIVDPGGDNWIAVGGDGFIDLLGKEGEPDVISGRIVFGGQDVFRSISGHDKWVVFGTGKLQSLDDNGQRVNEVRDALDGNLIKTAADYPMGWLIGGDNGVIQTLNTSGEPTVIQTTIFDADSVGGLAYSGVAWLGLSESGKILTFNTDLNIADAAGTQVLTEGIGALSNANINIEPRWLVFSKSQYATVTASGIAGPLTTLPSADIGSVHYTQSSVFMGAENGDIYRADYGSSLNFLKVGTMKTAVRHFVSNGQGKTLALAQNSILSLNSNDGSEVAPEKDIPQNLVSAHYSTANSEWILVYEKNGLIRFLESDLTPKQPTSVRLNGEQINGAAKGTEGVLVVGNAGMIQLVEDNGATISTPTQLDANVDLLDVEWNGKTFFVVGTKGFSQIISAAGSPESGTQLLDGGDINFASWSGSFYLIGGEKRFQIVRPTGVALGSVQTISDVTLYSAGFDGERWLAVGVGSVEGVAVFINEENNDSPTLIDVSIAVLKGVDFDGLEWLVGGSEGLIQRVSASGQKIGTPVSALDGLDIETVFFNGLQYLVGGELGAVRRVGSDFTPIRTTISITNSQDLRDVLWAKPRGFANGPCLTSDVCFAGPCIGGLAAGKCCDSACDRPCESCFQRDTGENDGTCSPVVVGKQSPKTGAKGCAPQPESSCGLTGFCDGVGECSFYESEIECSTASCGASFVGAGSCDGAGACSIPAAQSCSPYSGCNVDSGCQTSCVINGDCISGYECESGQCMEEEEDVITPTTGSKENPTPEEGCSSISTDPSGTFLLALLGLFVLVPRRRK